MFTLESDSVAAVDILTHILRQTG